MDDRDRRVRNVTYGLIPELGRPPRAAEAAREAGLAPRELRDAWRRLHGAHALVLEPDGTQIRMANPFSAVPTPHRVEAAGRSWYGNCAWDAFGICAALHADGRVETSCPDCDEPIAVEVHRGRPDDARLLFHCLVPAAHWWDDIVFT